MKKLILALSLILLFGSNSNASHVVGSDVFYQCTSTPGVYNVTFKLYRDCQGIQLCTNCPTNLSSTCSQAISISGAASPVGSGMPNSPCTGVSFGSQTIPVVTAVSGFDVVQLCATEKTICSNCGSRTPGSYTPGVEVYTFSGQINLSSIPSSCCFVSLGWYSCCRNNAITTLTNPSALNFYTEAIINRCVTPCNSSPSFTNDPVIVACGGQDFTYNIGAVDPDGDSLSYAFGQSMIGPGAAAPYVSPYSSTVPLPYLGAPIQSPPAILPIGIYLNSVSGDMQFRPMGTFVANLIIEVKQWKTIGGLPTLMGITRRDIQFYSKPCPNNNPPKIRTYDQNGVSTSPMPEYEYTIPKGKPFCTIISAWDDGATSDTTDITWNSPSPLVSAGATLTKLYDTTSRGINGPKKDSVRFCWTPPSNSPSNLPYYFVITAKDRACPIKGSTMHSFAINVYGCKANFFYGNNNSIQCLNGNEFSFTSSSSSKGGPISYHWDFGDSTQSNQLTGNHSYLRAGTFPVTLIITDSSGCTDTIVKEATVIPSPEIISIIGKDSNLATGLGYVYRANAVETTIYKWSVTNGILFTDPSIDSAIVVWNNKGAGSIRLDIENDLGCKDSLILLTHIDSIGPVCKADFTANSFGQCLNQNSFQFTNTSSVFGSSFYSIWDFGDGILDTSLNPNHSYSLPGTYLVKLGVASNLGCFDSTIKTISVYPQAGPVSIFGSDSNLINGTNYLYSVTAKDSFSYQWIATNGSIVGADNMDSAYVKWNASSTGKLKVIVSTAHNCKDSAEITVSILTSGIKETSNFGKISLYPNPNKGKFYLSLELPKTKEITLKIYNILGLEVMSLTKTIGSGKQEIELPTSLKAGVYFLNLSDGLQESQVKFVVED
ncbi:MAG: PKD domain-containing protein [Bacteroidia bacterium]|nr:PKD domain-containing protein [Bacteroidia bacterium]MCF8428163.1 PKD domain-containing protein [Bacteroidia bacterium]MCF8445427.1 PKD domain-containing protein [Bacteroidia bacterium]